MSSTSTLGVSAVDSDQQPSGSGPDTARTPAGAAPVTLHRRRGALALVGLGAGVAAVAYLWRAVTGDAGWLGVAFAAALAPIAVAHLAAWWDARVPLLVADGTGIRLRDGRTWTGLRWDEVAALNLTPQRRPRRDARLTVAVADGPHRPVRLALVDPADVRALPESLRNLAPAKVPMVVAEPSPAETDEPGGQTAEADSPSPKFRVPKHPPTPAAEVRAARADVVVEPTVDAAAGAVSSERDQERDPEPVATPSPATVAYTRADAQPDDPVIGLRLARARHRLRLSVDDLADRSRIRPHVIEAMEVDDFSACGGDVYARGHLRAIASILGIDGDELVAAFDERYATGPVPARKVFEAELAGPGRSLRLAAGGPRWSLLIGVVLVLVLLWGLARLLVPGADGDGSRDRGPDATPSASFDAPTAADAARFDRMGERSAPTRLRLSGTAAATDGPEDAADGVAADTPVTVRDGDGSVLFQGRIGVDEVRWVRVFGAATVVAADGGALTVDVDGRTVGRLGPDGEPVRRTLGG